MAPGQTNIAVQIRNTKEFDSAMQSGKMSWSKNRKKNTHLTQKKKKRKK